MNIHFTEASKKTSNKPSNYSLLAAAVAVIISIFFTYDLYSSSLQKSDELETLKVNEVRESAGKRVVINLNENNCH